jgi:sugar/nucleoside kinase (ribokinase family)
MTRLLVIGVASVDRLHLQDRTAASAGGAGMYTAMAAHRCGAQVALFGPRPDPCPEPLQPVARRLTEWLGPVVSPAQLPRFEISYRQGQTEYLQASLDAEAMASPASLPTDLSSYDHVHVCALAANANLQLPFVQACRQRGAVGISAGTSPLAVAKSPQVVRAMMEACDYFFMSGLEAEAVFGSVASARTEPGKVLYVTLGAEGACIIQGDTSTLIPGVPAAALDPTGAGDSFCGGTLAYLLQKEHPIMAARQAASLAAEMIGQVGPAALLSKEPPPGAPLDPHVRVDEGRVRSVAKAISSLPEVSPFPFTGTELPPLGHPKAVDYFFAATLQQFSFWSARDNRYHQPLIAPIGGVERKGSDYLWAAFTRKLEGDPGFCSPERQAALSREGLLAVFRADDGQDPMPALDLHLEQARQYGRDMLALQLRPQAVLDKALASRQPLQTFLVILDGVGGYKEDPIRKKSLLLAMILKDRPEMFFPLRDDEEIPPIMDYHFMRSCLRIGLIDVLDSKLRTKLTGRQVVSPAEEWAVRYPAYLAVEGVVAQSGRGLSAVNNLLFTNARKRCPEMTEPQCQSCALDAVCAHRKEFFQPVLRTTFY